MDDSNISSIHSEMVVLTRALEPGPAAKDRVRSFEDETFGKDAVRINGELEQGIGSPFAKMDAGQKAKYAALQALVGAEQRLSDARAALVTAEAEFETADAAAK